MARNYIRESYAKPHGIDKYIIEMTARVHGGKAYLDLTGGLTIEYGVIINEGVVIYTHNHHYGNIDWRTMGYFECPLVIQKDAWIGRNAMIMPSVTNIGVSSIIAPGSIVTKDVPDFEMWGGNPAKFIKLII